MARFPLRSLFLSLHRLIAGRSPSICACRCCLLCLPATPAPGAPSTSLKFSCRRPAITFGLGSRADLGLTRQGPSCPMRSPDTWGGPQRGWGQGGLSCQDLAQSCLVFPFTHFPPLPVISTQALISPNDTKFGGLGFRQEASCDPQSTGACLLLLGKGGSGRSAGPIGRR